MARVPLSSIVAEEKYQPRGAMDLMTVQRYAEKMRAGVIFPPILVGRRGKAYVLLDGWHRVAAARKAQRDSIEARVSGEPEARWILLVFEENAGHGLPLTQADVKHGMRRLSEAKVPVAEVARVFRVRPETVERTLAEGAERSPVRVVELATRLTGRPARVMAEAGVSAALPEAPPAEELHARVRDFIRMLDEYGATLQNDVGVGLLVQAQVRIEGLTRSVAQGVGG